MQLGIKLSTERRLLNQSLAELRAAELTRFRLAAYLDVSTKDHLNRVNPYRAVRFTFDLGGTTQCLSLAAKPAHNADASAWDWDTCGSGEHGTTQVFLFHGPSGNLRLADDPINTRIVYAHGGETAIESDQPLVCKEWPSRRNFLRC
jgi:hypothetical protein